MVKLKRVITKEDHFVTIQIPVSNEELNNRKELYDVLPPKKFAYTFKSSLFSPVEFEWNGKKYSIQYNRCVNPYCKWHGLPQERFNTKMKPSRYKLSSSRMKDNNRHIKCNPDPINPARGVTLGCVTFALSNWSIAEEISRLIRINSTKDIEPEYDFHHDGCLNRDSTPFNEPKCFYKRGKSTSKSQRYQCRECNKFTNVLPDKRSSTTYNQKRNDILPMFMKLLVNKNPISRTCEILEIGRSTYYHKLEWIYRCCLEFLEKHESKLKDMNFKEFWVNTDKMMYYLNNVRKKGQGGKTYDIEDQSFQTNIILSAENFSRYVLRGDIAYDWDTSFDDIAGDTTLYKEDHLNEFARKNGRFGQYSAYPQEPTINDSQSYTEFGNELNKINKRKRYVDGIHINLTYTTIAHLWLIRNLVNVSEWRLITDDDKSLKTSIFRVFADKFRLYDAYYFLCQTDKEITRKEAIEEYEQSKADLLEWGLLNNIDSKSLNKLAYLYLIDLFKTHKFHKEIVTSVQSYNIYGNNPIKHPLASNDRGKRIVDCLTVLSSLESKDVAKLILKVNDNSLGSFTQFIRRRLSVLERPLTTARGDGKSYIYSNFNPKYAQMALTILRTYYNYCLPLKIRGTARKTPAQRLGIAERQYTIKDILYMR